MNDLTLVDIFFILTGIAVIIITIMLAVGLIYVIMFLRTIKQVALTAQRATEIVSEDIADLRDTIKERGMSVGALTSFAKNLSKKKIFPKKK
ncbi:MAG: hypothetical protein M3Q64_02105 [bacterium]|nr:hypothetical protein [bacterium]